MTRKERLEYCTICMNRKPNLQKGLLCGLTNEHANFNITCADFVEDPIEKENKLLRDLNASGHQDASSSLDYKKNKQNGIIILFIGIAILLFSITGFNGLEIFILPTGIIFYGARTYYKGVEQEKILEKSDQFDKENKRF